MPPHVCSTSNFLVHYKETTEATDITQGGPPCESITYREHTCSTYLYLCTLGNCIPIDPTILPLSLDPIKPHHLYFRVCPSTCYVAKGYSRILGGGAISCMREGHTWWYMAGV